MVPFEVLINTAKLLSQGTPTTPEPVPPAIAIDRATILLRSLLSSAGFIPELTDAEATDAFHGFLTGDPSSFLRIAALHTASANGTLVPEDIEETLLFCVVLAVRAQWTRVPPVVVSAPIAPANTCPVCGGIGRLEIIAGEDGQRSLICPTCDARWRISRVGCPHCGEQDGSRLEVLSAATEPGRAMVHCRSCGRVWRRRDMGRQPYPDGMSLADAFLPWLVEASLCSCSGLLPVPLRVSAGTDALSSHNSVMTTSYQPT